jgi:hypothetical protein
MKAVPVCLFVAGLFAAACGSSSSTSPSPAPTVFTAQLLPVNEGVQINGGEGTGSGTATISFIVSRDSSNTIIGATTTFTVNLTGFPGTTVVNIAHIHEGAASVLSGPIKVNTTLTPGDVTLVNGTGSFTKQNIGVDPALMQAILNNPAGYYFNVHTAANPGGVARGQLVPQ